MEPATDDDELIHRLHRLGELKPAAVETERALERVRRSLTELSPVAAVVVGKPRALGWWIAAAVCLGLAVPLAWLALGPSPAHAGFDDIRAAMQARRSVACRQVRRIEGRPDETSRWLMFGDHRFRIDLGGGSYAVVDGARRRFLRVDAQAQEATLFDDGRPPPDNLYEALKDLPQGVAAQQLPQKRIDGRNVVGFTVSVEGRIATVWADPVARLPVQIQTDEQNAEGQFVSVTIDEFEFEKKLNPDLFSFGPPAGFAFTSIGLDELRGRWERPIPGSNPPLIESLTVEGDHDIYLLRRTDGTLVRKLSARVHLERVGDVAIYNRDEIQLVEGNSPPGGVPKTQSFIYKFDQKGLCEVSGLLHGRDSFRPRIATIRWVGPGKRDDRPSADESIADKPRAPSDDPDLRRDLEQMQGRWERIGRNAQGEVTWRMEKLVKGNQETRTVTDPHGRVLEQQTVRFRLEKHGPVRVFNFFERMNDVGDGAGLNFEVDFSYLYRIDGTTLLEAPGLFEKRPSYQTNPVVYIWARSEPRNAEKTANTPP